MVFSATLHEGVQASALSGRSNPRVQSLHAQLYDSPLDSMLWRLQDANTNPNPDPNPNPNPNLNPNPNPNPNPKPNPNPSPKQEREHETATSVRDLAIAPFLECATASEGYSRKVLIEVHHLTDSRLHCYVQNQIWFRTEYLT